MPTSIQYHRLRAPSEHGKTLQDPPLDSAGQVLHDNLQIDPDEIFVDDMRLTDLISIGRRELIELAIEYTSSYRNVSHLAIRARGTDQIVMSGHQPKLFHPGVWYKNFALSELAQRLNCTAVNLVVDNDICGVASIQVPEVRQDRAAFGLLPIDAAGDNVPFECRQIEDPNLFDAFANRASTAIKPYVDQPIVDELWPNAIEFRKRDNRLGQVLATSRHAMELDFGLKTLEVPLSLVAQTRAFAHFAKHLLENLSNYQSIHNNVLAAYRKVHKIRSRSHPVPPLESDGPWLEAPLWVWDADQPLRRRLFAKMSKDTIVLTDRQGIVIEIGRANFVERFSTLTVNERVAVRPRALMTTMFGRTVLSDLFLHGIGGAKYDQLSDELIDGFLGLKPPRFMTLTATMKLPLAAGNVQPADFTRIKRQLRELTFHPEAHLPVQDQATEEIAKRKYSWVHKELPRGTRRERHQEIVRCNELLQPHVEAQREILVHSQSEVANKIRINQVLGSREFSFCLFPVELMSQLRELAV